MQNIFLLQKHYESRDLADDQCQKTIVFTWIREDSAKDVVRAEIRANINYKSSFANHFLWSWNPLVIVHHQSMHDIFCLSGIDRERHSLNRMLDK